MDYQVTDDEVTKFKKALYIEVTDDDEMIKDYLKAAKAYVQGAVDPSKDLSAYPQYDFAVQMLAQFWYQSRGIDLTLTPWQVRSMIQQLRGIN